MQEKRLVVILADISGYTRFMLENRASAVHGQLCINFLIESVLEKVDIPLTLQEIEGDAVFLHAADPGSEEAWQATLEEVSRKLPGFFEAFIARTGVSIESTPCGCAICRNSEQLGLKIIVHVGEAVFHEVAGRSQVSGPDVILTHRLLKNSLESNEYLLLTEPAFERMGRHLPGRFEIHEETYEGGDAYFAPPGHLPYLFAGSEVVEFHPTAELMQRRPFLSRLFVPRKISSMTNRCCRSPAAACNSRSARISSTAK